MAEQWHKAVSEGLEITRNWFTKHALQILEEEYPEEVSIQNGEKVFACQLSDGWFREFKERYKISFRAPTSQAQQTPSEYLKIVSEFLGYVRYNSLPRQKEETYDIGCYQYSTIFNVDQMPLPFGFYGNRTYAPRGVKSVKKKVASKAWTKRQASLMILITVDGLPHCKPLLMFRGQGKQGTIGKEREFYDKWVAVVFNKTAYTDTDIMLQWIGDLYTPAVNQKQSQHSPMPYSDGQPPFSAPRLLVLDTCPTHCTLSVLQALSSPILNTTTAFIPEGMTGYLQPEDTHINKPLKQYIGNYLSAYTEAGWKSGFPAKQNLKIPERRILITKCVGDAWDKLHGNHADLISRSFRDTGIALKPDGSDDHFLSVQDMSGLQVDTTGCYGLNCNLEIGQNGKRQTGKGLLQEDDWERLLALLGGKGALATAKEVSDGAVDEILPSTG